MLSYSPRAPLCGLSLRRSMGYEVVALGLPRAPSGGTVPE